MSATNGRPLLTIWINGREASVRDGQSVAAALLEGGIRAFRTTHRTGRSRGMFCGIGVCFDCVMEIDGKKGVRSCLEPVRAGMKIEVPQGGAIVGA